MEQRRTWSRILALTMGIPLLLALLASCGFATGVGSGSTSVIEIGVDLPLSGQDMSNGISIQNGAMIAIQEANAANAVPGYKIVLVPKDDASDPQMGSKNVSALITDALVAGIIGPFSNSVAQSVMPEANKASIALISPSNTDQCLTQEDQKKLAVGCAMTNDLVPTLRPTSNITYFRISPTDNHQGTFIADYLYKQKNYMSAYIIDDGASYGIGIANAFEGEWGGTVIDHKSVPKTTTSFLELLKAAAQGHADVIFCGCTGSTIAVPLRRQMLQMKGLEKAAFAGGNGIQTTDFANAVGLSGGPSYASALAVNPETLPAIGAFATKYKTLYSPYEPYAASGYDCAKILVLAIKSTVENGTTPPTSSNDMANGSAFRKAVISAVQNIDYMGVTGHHTFDGNGDTMSTAITVAIYQLQGDVNNKPAWSFVTQLSQ